MRQRRHHGLPIATPLTKITLSSHHTNPGCLIRPQLAGFNSPGDKILFEGCPPLNKKKKYPLCIEGERACPPEDVGGVWGYATFLEARNDPDHEEYEMYSEWGAGFDPETFDPKKATREMKKGLPDWRRMR